MQLSPRENLSMAMAALWTHRFRSGLTILGIVIGITTVVTVSSLLTGVQRGIVTFFEELGPDNIFLIRDGGGPGNNQQRRRRDIPKEYVDEVGRLVPSVLRSAAWLQVPSVIGGNPLVAKVPGFESDTVEVAGASYTAFMTQPRALKEGRVFTQTEDSRAEKVAVLGSSIASALFPAGRAVGRVFQVDGAEYRVIGVAEPAKGGFLGENDQDRQVIVPIRTVELRYPQLKNYTLVFQAYPERRDEAFEEIQGLVRRLRRVAKNDEDDFFVTTPDQVIAQFNALTRIVLLVSIAISGLGLLVGGIGVMNIMLVSVTERTREIGVRKAVGARQFDIITQFLMEAVALTGAGGLIGIVVAIAMTLGVGVLVPSLESPVPLVAAAVGFGVSVAIGVFFGVWPAVKAARLDPVEALRHE